MSPIQFQVAKLNYNYKILQHHYDKYIKRFDDYSYSPLKDLSSFSAQIKELEQSAKKLQNEVSTSIDNNLVSEIHRIQSLYSALFEKTKKIIAGREKFDKALEGLPNDKRYVLFIDKDQQNEGPFAFDLGEPGYYFAMTNAIFGYVRDHIEERVDYDHFIELHDHCINEVWSENLVSFDPNNEKERSKFTKGIDLNITTDYGIDHPTLSITSEAKEEWLTEKLIISVVEAIKIYKQNHTLNDEEFEKYIEGIKAQFLSTSVKSTVTCNLVKKKNARDVINELFNVYYDRIEKASSEKEKLLAIARICRALEIFHVYDDANQRTIVNGLLLWLLIQEGLVPVVLENPFVFDGYHSAKELVEDIKKGNINFKAFCQ